jgi:hypothetical protein
MKPTEHAIRRLEDELRRTKTDDPLPPGLHDSIVRAVRTAAHSPARPPAPRLLLLRWVAAPAFALVVAACVWWALARQSPVTPTLAVTTIALKEGQTMPQQASAAMLAPLSEEMELLHRDLRSAVDFLAASVP